MIRILNLTIKRKPFDEIRSGKKIIENREIKPYWTKRLLDKDGLIKFFDEIHFRNGYSKDSPFMRVEWWGMITNRGKYEILLGNILEIKNLT